MSEYQQTLSDQQDTIEGHEFTVEESSNTNLKDFLESHHKYS